MLSKHCLPGSKRNTVLYSICRKTFLNVSNFLSRKDKEAAWNIQTGLDSHSPGFAIDTKNKVYNNMQTNNFTFIQRFVFMFLQYFMQFTTINRLLTMWVVNTYLVKIANAVLCIAYKREEIHFFHFSCTVNSPLTSTQIQFLWCCWLFFLISRA